LDDSPAILAADEVVSHREGVAAVPVLIPPARSRSCMWVTPRPLSPGPWGNGNPGRGR